MTVDVVQLGERETESGTEFLVGVVDRDGIVTSRLVIPDAPGLRERLATGQLNESDLSRGRTQ